MPSLTDSERLGPLVRLLRLARRLDGQSFVPPVHTLAADYGVHPRTIRRDLNALERAGWPVPRWRASEMEHV